MICLREKSSHSRKTPPGVDYSYCAGNFSARKRNPLRVVGLSKQFYENIRPLLVCLLGIEDNCSSWKLLISMDGYSKQGPSMSRTSATRGRIAQVLASARASLQEPSRPVTPLTLDQRTALSFSTTSIPSEGIARQKLLNSSSSSGKTSKVLTSASVDAPLQTYTDVKDFPSSSSSIHQDLIQFLSNMSDMIVNGCAGLSDGEFYTALQQLKGCLTSSSRSIRAQAPKNGNNRKSCMRITANACALQPPTVCLEFEMKFCLFCRTCCDLTIIVIFGKPSSV